MGDAEPALSHKLAFTYFSLLDENDILPAAICFYTEGIKLCAEGSPVVDVLRRLENKGVRLILCGTCIAHFGLTEKVAVGIVGGMTDILEAQRRAAKVISI